jgi:hypothetical protein
VEMRSKLQKAKDNAEAQKGQPPKTEEGILPVSGWIAYSSPEAPLMLRMRSGLSATPAPFDLKPSGDGWATTSIGGETRIALVGDRCVLTSSGQTVPTVITAAARTPAIPDAELEFALYLDPGRPTTTPTRTGSGSLRFGPEGLRFSAVLDSLMSDPVKMPVLDRHRFDSVPAGALCAGAIALNPQDRAFSVRDMLVAILTPLAAGASLSPEEQAACNAAGLLCDRIDGVVIAWIEPGMEPSLTLEADLAPADADAVFTTAGLTRGADGCVSVQAGPVQISLGYGNGRLTITTNPAGIAGIDRNGGFTRHPEIQRALAAMPAGPISACALLRPAATLELAMPFGAMLVPQLQSQLMEYHAGLVKNQCYSFLTAASDGTKTTIDACGIFSLVGCAVLGKLASDPAALMRVAN